MRKILLMSFHYPSVIQRFIQSFYLQHQSVFQSSIFRICCFLSFLSITTTTWAQTPDANGVLYVKKGSSGTGNSWANAIGELGDALQAATTLNASAAGTVKQIWVSAGTYYPTQTPDGSSTDKAKTFLLLTDVKIYGGFAGTETAVSDRDLTNISNASMLSGDLGTVNDASDNAYHVVLGVNSVGSAELNGFTITGGNANDNSNNLVVSNINVYSGYGGGLYFINGASPILSDLTITSNTANFGGGMFNYKNSSPSLTNVTFISNSASGNGGAIYSEDNSPLTITNSTFTSNSASQYGGAIYSYANSSLTITNSTFASNTSSSGGAIFIALSTLTATKVQFRGNSSTYRGGGVYTGTQTVYFTDVLFSGNRAYDSGGACLLYASNTSMVNTTVADNSSSSGGAFYVFYLSGINTSSLAIKNSVIYGNSSGITSTGTFTSEYSLIQGIAEDTTTHMLDGSTDPGFVSAPGYTAAPFTSGNYQVSLGASPLVNAGSNALYTGLNASSTDLAGNARVTHYADGSFIDIGAYENTYSIAQTITASDITKTYGDADFEPGAYASSEMEVSYTSNDTGIALPYQDTTDDDKWKIQILSAGTVTITVSQSGNGLYDTAPNVTFTLTINKTDLMVKATDTSQTYNGVAYSGGNGVTFTGFVNGDDVTDLSGSMTYSGTSQGAVNVGGYVITPAGYTSPNYTITYQNGTLSIIQATLTITANAQNKVYGETDPTFTYTTSGFINGDDASILTGDLSRIAGENVGTYIITQGTLSAGNNYSISLTSNLLTITEASLLVTADAQTKVYGTSDPTLTYVASGFKNGDDYSMISGVLSRATGENVGTYAINQNTLSAGANYIITYTGNVLTITKAVLTITADAKTKVYGDADPGLTYTASGFMNGDDSTILTGALSRDAGENAGSYAINQNTLSVTNNNYTIAYTSNTLTITKAILQVVADVQTKIYGETDPAFTYTPSGFVSGDDASILTGILSRVPGENVGAYTITQGSLSAGNNYSISLTDNTLTITQASLLITADAQTKVYGTVDPALTYVASGFKNGDNNSVFSGSLTRDLGENAGAYAINQNTLSAGANYIITYTGNVLTITKAPQFITWQQDLTVGCDGSAAPMQLTAITNSGLPVNYIVTNTTIATSNGDILTPVHEGSTTITAVQEGDENHFPAVSVENTFNYQLFGRVRQHWSDVIFFDNTGGSYVSWQWYKNGIAVSSGTDAFYSESSALNGSYYVLATDKSGNTVQSCALVLTGSSTVVGGIKIYPNPSRPGETVTITCNYTSAALQGAKLTITNLTGTISQQITSVAQENQVTMPLTSGVYIVTLILNDGQKATVNVIVN